MTDAPAPAEPDWPLSLRLDVARLPASGQNVVLEADAAERAAVARRLGILALDSLRARLVVTPRGKRVLVKGELTAEATQACVVTLEPVAEKVREEIDLVFASPDEVAEAEARAFKELEDGSKGLAIDPATLLDPQTLPEPYENGQIDVWVVAQETLSLGLDPYPRKPGAVFEQPDDGRTEASPFAALGKLKS